MHFEDSAHAVTVDGVLVDNSGMIPGMGRSGDAASTGINVSGNGTTIRHSRIVNSGFNGISFMGNDVLIEENYVDTFDTVKDDGAGIYTVITSGGITASNRIIRKNIVLNAIGAFAGAESNYWEAYGKAPAIYLDDYSNHTLVCDNVMAHGNWTGIFLNGGTDNQVKGNTVFDFPEQLAMARYANRPVRNMEVTGNRFVGRTAAQKGMGLYLWENDSPSLFGLFDLNAYVLPMNSAVAVTVDRQYSGGGGAQPLTLDQWKSGYAQDRNSTGSPVSFPAGSNPDECFRFLWNDTLAPVSFPLSASYVDAANVAYAGSITLQPYTGTVLLKTVGNSAPSVSLTAPINATIFTAPATITISASASDSDGSVARVEFYQGASLIGSSTAAPYSMTWTNVPAGSYAISAVATDNAGARTTSGSVGVTVKAPATPTGDKASFIKIDTTTQGSWKNVYAQNGYAIAASAAQNPAGMSMAFTSKSDWVWAASTADARALQKPAATDRIASCWYGVTTFDITIDSGSQSSRLAMYCVDFDKIGRSQKIDVLDSMGRLLDTRSLANFSGGQYLVWDITGKITLRIAKVAGANAVVSGLFFGPVPAAGAARYVTADAATQGSWKSMYGQNGYAVAASSAQYPAGMNTLFSGKTDWTWLATTTDARCLEKPAATDRIASCWYGASFDIAIDSGLQGSRLALYCLDFDNGGRNQKIDVLDSADRLLDTRNLASDHRSHRLLLVQRNQLRHRGRRGNPDPSPGPVLPRLRPHRQEPDHRDLRVFGQAARCPDRVQFRQRPIPRLGHQRKADDPRHPDRRGQCGGQRTLLRAGRWHGSADAVDERLNRASTVRGVRVCADQGAAIAAFDLAMLPSASATSAARGQ